MNKAQEGKQTTQKQAQRPSPTPDGPLAELAPVQTGLENAAQLNGLPAVPSSRGIRQATVLRMQQQQGNTAVQRYLARANRSQGHSQAAPAAETENEGQETLGAGAPTLAPSPPPPNPNGNGTNGNNGSNGNQTTSGVILVQREDAEGEDDTPTEAEKAAALAAARAAEAQANQSANEAHQEVDKSKSAKDSEQQVGDVAKGKADQAKGEAQAIVANSAAANGTAPTAVPKAPTAKPAANGTGGAPPPTAALVPGEQGADYVAPKSSAEDPAFQGVTTRVKETATTEATHAPATDKAKEAAAAAEMPASETAAHAQNNQAGEMENAPTPDFDAAAFKARLMQRIQEMAPKNAEEADEFKESNKLDGVKGEASNQTAAERDKTKTPMAEATAAAPNTGAIPPKPTTPIPDAEPGAAPPPMGAEQAVPKEKGVGEVEQPLRESSQSLDNQMADAEVTEEQLANSNEPEFTGALASKEEAQTHANEAPVEVRAAEQEHIATAQAEATAVAEQQTQAMHTERTGLLNQVEGRQDTAKTEDEQARAKVSADINTIYEETKSNVEAILDRLDGEVERVFSAGAEAAKKAFEDYVDAKMEAYKEERYGGWLGWARWIKDKLAGMPSEVNVFYAEGRNLFIGKMDAVIDNVVAIIGRGMAEAKAEIANGRKRIQDYIAQLPQDLQAVGQEAADNIQSQFDQLEQTVNDKQNALIDTLASKYQEHLQAVDARIEEMKAANAGLIDKALNAIVGVIKVILELKDMLLNVLSRAAEAIGKIISGPIEFLGNLINAIKQGFSQFIDNIGTHLQQGFIGWLTGSLGEAGITLPETFDLPGILQLVMQILGISFEQIMGKVSQVLGIDLMGIYGQIMELVTIYQEQGLTGLARYGLERLIGAEGVEALMEVVQIFQVIQSGDFGQLWEIIQQHLSDLKEMIFGKIEEFIVERVIKAGITWLISLFNPAGAFIRACKMIYDVVMFFIERGSQIMSLVNAIIDSITSIASGNISAAANFIEQALARAIPVAISFLSSLLGLGNISEKVQEIINSVRTAVDNAIDKILNSRPVQMVAGFIKRVVGRITSFIQRGVNRVGTALGFDMGEGEQPDQGDGRTGDGEVGETVNFAAGGGSHRMWYNVQGATATMMVASETTTVESKIQQWENSLNENGELLGENRARATTLIASAKSMLATADQQGDEAAKEKQEAEQDQGDGQKETEFEQADQEAEQAQQSLTEVLRQLFELFGEEAPVLQGDAKIKMEQVMADRHIPNALRSQYQDAVFRQLVQSGPDADQYGILKSTAAQGDYFAKGPDIPTSEVEDKGGMTRVIPLKTIWDDNLAPDYQKQFNSFEAWLKALAENPSNFDPNAHLNPGSTVPGRYATAWWAPRSQQQGNTIAELIVELALNPATYEGGCVRVTVSAAASKVAGFKKPTALDAIFFTEFVPAPDNAWGVTGGGSLEAVAPRIALSDVTLKEFLPANLPAPPPDMDQAIQGTEQPLLDESGGISKENAETVAQTVMQQNNDVTVTVLDGGDTWDYTVQRMSTKKSQESPAVDLRALVNQIGSVQVKKTGSTYYVTQAGAGTLIGLLEQIPGVQVRNFPKGFTVYRDGAEWYFERNDTMFEEGAACDVNDPELTPNAAFVEIHGFRGVRTLNGVKLPRNPKQPPDDSAFYRGDLSDFDPQSLPAGISMDALTKARNYVERTLLMYAGHIGLSLNGGQTIHGWTPMLPEGMSEGEFHRRLFAGETFAGSLNDDTWVFKMAAEFASTLGANTNVVVSSVRIDPIKKQEIAEKVGEVSASSSHGLEYGFPNENQDPSIVANCATAPGRHLGAPIPEQTGVLRDYMPALEQWAMESPVDKRGNG